MVIRSCYSCFLYYFNINKISHKVVQLLKRKKLKISIVESCTGGKLASSITSINGSSKVFTLALITYSNESKSKIAHVSKKLIKKYGAVSEQVCKAMAVNVGKIAKTNISISITGIAGPQGGSRKKPVGLVYIGVKKGNKTSINKYLFPNKGRKYIQDTTVKKSLKLILDLFK